MDCQKDARAILVILKAVNFTMGSHYRRGNLKHFTAES
jgi:hypothetical protein